MTEYLVMTTTDPPPDRLLTTAEVAQLTGYSSETVRRYADRGLLVSQRPHGSAHRRFRESDVEAFIKASRSPAAL